MASKPKPRDRGIGTVRFALSARVHGWLLVARALWDRFLYFFYAGNFIAFAIAAGLAAFSAVSKIRSAAEAIESLQGSTFGDLLIKLFHASLPLSILIALGAFLLRVATLAANKDKYSKSRAPSVEATRFLAANPTLKVAGGADGLIAYDPGLNAAFARRALDATGTLAPLKVAFQKKRFELAPHLKPFVPVAMAVAGWLTINERKVRLESDLNPRLVHDGGEIELRATDYFRTICTNSFSNYDVVHRASGQPTLRGHDLFLDHDRLRPLADSLCSNHLGGSSLLLTKDGKLWLTRQGALSAQAADLWAPTGSGSFDLDRQKARLKRGGLDFLAFCVAEIERELQEETGFALQAGLFNTRIIGMGRQLYRGGKPDMIAVTAYRGVLRPEISHSEYYRTEGHGFLTMTGGVTPGGLIAVADDLLARISADPSQHSGVLALHAQMFREFLDMPGAKEALVNSLS